MKKVAILQSNYIPWKGYFDMMAAVDEFILYDDVQFTSSDWRNRNKIKTRQGVQWLTVPVVKDFGQKIRDTRINGTVWATKHWKTIAQNYSRAPYFSEVAAFIQPLYLEHQHELVSDMNRAFLEIIRDYLGITTKISWSWDYQLIEGKTERLVDLCHQTGGDEYISGPAAKSYIDERLFDEAGIKLTWFDYEGYPEYPQLWGEFTHQVTVLDLLFNCGPESKKYMRYIR